MLVLFETPAGFALFKVLDEGKLKKPKNIFKEFQDVDAAQKIVSLSAFHKFGNTTEALAAVTALNESDVSDDLERFLKKSIVQKKLTDKLAVADSKLGGAINTKLSINCITSSAINELLRGIRMQMENLITGLSTHDMNAMVLGLSHSLSRYKLKFSPDKIDTMVVQAVGLLDDLDKELNTYAMRVKEWYGWHFPEMQKIVPDNLMYAKIVKAMGMRSNAKDTDLSDVAPEELEEEVKSVAKMSMGTEINEEDLLHIHELCDQVIEMSKYREQLFEYLQNRMIAIAPNLTILVGALVGARLIAHAGSLMNLAKHPASTVQILGAEKALFRALKTKHATPKYGLIYHANLITKATAKNKGKMSRVLANKCALSIRVDALGNTDTPNIGVENREKVEARLRQLEGYDIQIESSLPKNAQNLEVYSNKRSAADPTTMRSSNLYNEAADTTISEDMDVSESSPKKKKKKKKKKADAEATDESVSPSKKKKKKKKKKADAEATDESVSPSKKKKKKKRKREDSDDGEPKKRKKK